MKSKFINKNNDKLILFFNGWGMDELVVSHLGSEDFDVCIFYHYDEDFGFDKDILKNYKEIYLIAWSMGVWSAAKSLQEINIHFNKSIAINGTLSPVNDSFGIPKDIFKGTIEHFSERNKQKFDRRMLGSKEDFQRFRDIPNSRTLVNQLSELELIYKLAKDKAINFSLDKAIIGTRDLIFPTQNQINFWSKKTEVKEIDSAHFPFYNFNTWSEIVQL